jgi:hypothetical protein
MLQGYAMLADECPNAVSEMGYNIEVASDSLRTVLECRSFDLRKQVAREILVRSGVQAIPTNGRSD